ncbi:ParB/RepB/Spo0J family partition protein [Nocardia sp. alder85J]|uniref:ParB/RepB/Spo0J family partition protein n=1 Tax=Nocardia sp. alder85J TaxID=2862949 RepID=UPI001CD528CD|nr:ParB N-terminal domain-containing protein [Nocardia sp. alder85J]MCX4099269.1 ParB N-terminal domain-containing protein [Nocardia sp. alder85J]
MAARARGGARNSLADLIDAVGDKSPVDGDHIKPGRPAAPTSALLAELVANPRNPRSDLGDLSDLESIGKIQLQPALVVTREAYLRLYPEDEAAIGDARWVVVNGCRRLAAAHLYGCTMLEIVVKDAAAASRAVLLAVSIIENVARAGFDVLEESRAVDALVTECGSAQVAAEQLGRSTGWVSQRRALLELTHELQDALRRGDLAIRVARTLARVPQEDQVARWLASQDKPAPVKPAPKPPRPAADAPQITKALKRLSPAPAVLADALTGYLDPDQLQTLVAALTRSLTEREAAEQA